MQEQFLGAEKMVTAHDCEENLEERLATPEQPYHYVGSGLPNVFLSGVKYFVCKLCGKQAAEIPALKELLAAIARTVVDKPSALTGYEIRFLRKRLSKRSIEFAPLIDLTPERLSTVENKNECVAPARDRLVRIIFRLLSGDAAMKNLLSIESKFEKWLTSIHGRGDHERIVAKWHRNNHQWKVETNAQAA
jgi:DNA-binding transcriptional regulator YiaG